MPGRVAGRMRNTSPQRILRRPHWASTPDRELVTLTARAMGIPPSTGVWKPMEKPRIARPPPPTPSSPETSPEMAPISA